MDKPRSVLIIRLKSMGDIVFTLPAVHAVRESLPDARISFLVSKEYAPLLNGFPEVASVIELNRERFRGLHPIKMVQETASVLRRIKSQRPDLTIDLQGYGETALLTRASGAAQRWGTVYRPGRSWAYTQSVPRHADVHPAEDYLLLLRGHHLAGMTVRNRFNLPKQFSSLAGEFLSDHGLRADRPTLFVQPFTSAAEKNWPLDRYLEVAKRWKDRKWQVLFGGGPTDRAALEPVRQAGYPVAAGVPLLVSAGLAQASALVLGADTGLVHLAVAMGKRVVMIMRSPFSGSTHPFQHQDWAICPANKDSLASIRSQAVDQCCVQACAELGICA
jgi:ADP-heptose:LPS heptosyltransferase